jgi:hypothetical protein
MRFNAAYIITFFVSVSAVFSSPASAVVLQYRMNIQFEDGDSAQGSFLFDSEFLTIFDTSFRTTGGTVFPSLTLTQTVYSDVPPELPRRGAFVAVEENAGPDFTGVPGLNVVAERLGLPAPNYLFVGLVTCQNSDCSGVTSPGLLAVSVNGRPLGEVPLPTTGPLICIALLLLCWARMRAKRPGTDSGILNA